MNKWLKRTGLVICAYLVYTIQRLTNEHYVNQAYMWGVSDGQKIERHNAWARSNQTDKEIIRTKYERYGKVAE